MKFLFIVPVWGKDYAQLFAETCLPLLVTPNNLLAFESEDAVLTIVANTEAFEIIEASPAIAEARKAVEVRYILTDGMIALQQSHSAMTEFYYLAMRQADVEPRKTRFVFLTPDSFWSDGTFADLKDSSERGHKVVATLGVRVLRSKVIGYLTELGKRSTIDRVVPNTKLVDLAMRNLHPLGQGHIWNSNKFLSAWPSNIYLTQLGHAMYSHNFHLHPLMMVCPEPLPSTSDTIDGDFIEKSGYSYDDIDVVTTSKRFVGIEISPDGRNWGQDLGPPNMTLVRMFALWRVSPVHWFFFSKRIVYSVTEERDEHTAVFENLLTQIHDRIHQYKFYSIWGRRLGVTSLVVKVFDSKLLRRLGLRYVYRGILKLVKRQASK